MKRKIIKINEALCNGCGQCTTGCSEGALQIIDGVAKLVREDFCDGFGDCIGTCPTGALTIEEREADDFDLDAVKEHLLKNHGEAAVRKMQQAHKKHESQAPMGCPGMRQMSLKKNDEEKKNVNKGTEFGLNVIPSELEQWPVQLHLVSPQSNFFKNKEMVILSTCAPVASADVHWKYLRGRSVVVACPKLDRTDPYVDKLAEIFKETSISKVIVLRMEVPCCGGLSMIARSALKLSGRGDLTIEEHILSLNGSLISIERIS